MTLDSEFYEFDHQVKIIKRVSLMIKQKVVSYKYQFYFQEVRVVSRNKKILSNDMHTN